MTIAVEKKFWTDEELLALPSDGCDREVIDGELVVSPANGYHERSISALFLAMGNFIAERHLGEILGGQLGVRMADGSLLSPDISFVTETAWKAYEDSGESFLNRSPVIVVEVLSPSDTFDRVERKLELYFANGTQLAWVVHPRSKSVRVYRDPLTVKVLRIGEFLEGEDILPGFKFDISRLF